MVKKRENRRVIVNRLTCGDNYDVLFTSIIAAMLEEYSFIILMHMLENCCAWNYAPVKNGLRITSTEEFLDFGI